MDLIDVRFKDNNNLEEFSLSEGFIWCSFLLLPSSISEAVQGSMFTNVWLVLKRNVITIGRPSFKIDFKSVKKAKINLP